MLVKSFVLLLFMLVGGFISPFSFAQNYPVRPIKLVIPYSAGGSASIIGRTLAQRLSVQLPYPVIVDNRGGAAAQIGTEYVTKSAADGIRYSREMLGQLRLRQHFFQSFRMIRSRIWLPLVCLAPLIA